MGILILNNFQHCRLADRAGGPELTEHRVSQASSRQLVRVESVNTEPKIHGQHPAAHHPRIPGHSLASNTPTYPASQPSPSRKTVLLAHSNGLFSTRRAQFDTDQDVMIYRECGGDHICPILAVTGIKSGPSERRGASHSRDGQHGR